jgi:hypothetical protein
MRIRVTARFYGTGRVRLYDRPARRPPLDVWRAGDVEWTLPAKI